MANELSNDYHVTIFTIYAKGELEKQLSSKVKHKSLEKVSYEELSKFQKKVIQPLKVMLLKPFLYRKKVKGDYEVEVAFLEGPITRLFSSKNKKTRKIAWIHNDLSLVFGKGIKAKLKKKIDEKVYQNYEKLIFVSQDNLEKFNQIYSKIKGEKKVIYNYLKKESILEKAQEYEAKELKADDVKLVTVARLVEQKGIDRFIKVHKKLLENGYQHKVYVIGDGPLREKLEKQIKENKVEDTFYLLGKKENPYPYIKKADYFCLFSYFEGYGMVLEEAKILNKYIVLTNTAAREAVRNYQEKKIVENTEDSIYEGLKELIQTKDTAPDAKNILYNNKKIIEEVKKVIEEQTV